MILSRKPLLVTALVLGCLGILAVGAWGTWMWYIYSYHSGLEKPVKDDAFRQNRTVRITELRAGTYMLQGDGGNVTALVGDEGILIVDTDEDWMAPKIEAALRTLSDAPIRYVVNTHFHGDHRGGNAYFRSLGAEIIAHVRTRQNIAIDTYAPAKEADLPTVTFQDDYRLRLNGQEIRIGHLPNAHTDGDAYVHFIQANVIATGDAFVFGGFPYLSVGTHGTIDGHLAGQDVLLGLADAETLIVPGHGGLTRKSGLRETRDRLQDIRDHVARLKEEGIPLRLARALHPTYAWRQDWRGPYVTDRTFSSLVYRTLPEE